MDSTAMQSSNSQTITHRETDHAVPRKIFKDNKKLHIGLMACMCSTRGVPRLDCAGPCAA